MQPRNGRHASPEPYPEYPTGNVQTPQYPAAWAGDAVPTAQAAISLARNGQERGIWGRYLRTPRVLMIR